jgi:hypothetical protein
MVRDIKEAAMKSNGKTAAARMPIGVRIAMIAFMVLLVLLAGVAAANLAATATFNQATASLNSNIQAAQDASTDADTLNVQQQQTDAQFAEAGRMRALLLPQVRQAIDANASVSSQLTKITLKRVDASHNGNGEQNQAEQQAGTSSQSKSRQGGKLSDEQKQQVEELMKANQQSTDSESNTTNKSEQKATQNSGTGTTKPW